MMKCIISFNLTIVQPSEHPVTPSDGKENTCVPDITQGRRMLTFIALAPPTFTLQITQN